MSTDRDHELGSALLELPVPEHHQGFWEELEQRLGDDPGPARRARRRWRPSPGVWLTALAAAVALVVAAVAVLDDPPGTRVTVTPAGRPDGATGPTPTPDFPGIFPDTDRGRLDAHVRAVAGGDTASPLDLEGVVRDYLADRGVTSPVLEPAAEGDAAAVRYTVAGQAAGGTVRLARVAEDAWVVTSATTELLQWVEVRPDGGRLVVTAEAAVPGEVSVRVTAPPGNGSAREGRAPGDPGTPTEVVLDHPALGAAAVVRAEITTPGAGRGFAELRVGPPAPASAGGLGPASTLSADGIGPVRVGMTFEAAEQAAATPVAVRIGTYCDELLPSALPDVALVGTLPGRTVSMVFVRNEVMRTTAGVGVGSSADEVVRAHGEPTRRSPDGGAGQWLLYAGPGGEAGPALRFDLLDGRVEAMVAGLGVTAEEPCA